MENHLVSAKHERYPKTAADCLQQLVIESSIKPLGYPVYSEWTKVMHIIHDLLLRIEYHSRQHTMVRGLFSLYVYPSHVFTLCDR